MTGSQTWRSFSGVFFNGRMKYLICLQQVQVTKSNLVFSNNNAGKILYCVEMLEKELNFRKVGDNKFANI